MKQRAGWTGWRGDFAVPEHDAETAAAKSGARNDKPYLTLRVTELSEALLCEHAAGYTVSGIARWIRLVVVGFGVDHDRGTIAQK
jgi:hypothetical protein